MTFSTQPNIWSLWGLFPVHLRTAYAPLLWSGMYYRYLLVFYSIVCFSIYFLVYFLSGSFIPCWKWGVKVSKFMIAFSVFFLKSVSFCFMYFRPLLLGVYVFILIIYFWRIYPFILINHQHLFLKTILELKFVWVSPSIFFFFAIFTVFFAFFCHQCSDWI